MFKNFFLFSVAFILLYCLPPCFCARGAELDHSITVTEPLTNAANAEAFLYPAITPYEEGYLKVSARHSLWYGKYGNPKGVPIVFLHGGPGAGCGNASAQFFDPKHYLIILFDQRGAVRSKPFGEIRENTTKDLLKDLEKLRTHLKVDKWILFGGSWGSTLAIAYGEAYPNRCLGFVLRGIFLGTKEENDYYWYHSKMFFPDAWDKMNNFIPRGERKDLIKAYHKRILNSDPKISKPAIDSLISYDLRLGFAYLSPQKLIEYMGDEKDNISCARGFIHYSYNLFFLKEGELMENVHKISHLPAIFINGRYDAASPVKTAYDLYQKWPNSHLVIVSNAGHAGNEIGTTKALVEATNRFKDIIHP